MKKIIGLLLGFCILYSFPLPVDAHVLKMDGNIGVIIHISPDDDPIVGKESNFFFEFKDKQGKFSPEKCDCVVSISTSGSTLFTQTLFTNTTDPSLRNASLTYTFPTTGVYQAVITGNPITKNAFTPFHLIYDIRVDKTIKTENVTSSSWISSYIPYIAVGIITCGFLISVILFKKKWFIKERR